ncbi:nitrate transport protein [Corynebacterium renale]|uniref:ABC transporter substrate-binding protein n=1 Tax=Corynebacterium renale TaxID=1724 RepID=UPI000DA3FEDA|nr:ABC transporter substrate-binding protein [Corynebacterium renale]SQG63679.1 nitrate transport protein [Corynebacterium renale]STD01550.1 nitrate transport protein [Corynebacterium renale]
MFYVLMNPHRRISRRRVLHAMALASAAALTGCSTQARSSEAITIGFVPIACSSPLLAAHGLDLFAQHGVTVNLRKFSGWADLWTAYATGELDVAHMLSPMPLALEAGSTNARRPTVVAFTQNTNGQALTLAAKHHPAVREVADLRGMVLGIPFEYSVHALLLRDYLEAGGLDSVRDLELRLLRPADMIAQLSVGTIDGFIGPEPFLQRALSTGAGRIFTLTKEMWDGHPCCSIAMARDFYQDNTDTATRIIAALTEGAAYVNDPAHAPEASTLLAQEKYLNQKKQLIQPALEGTYLAWDDTRHADPNYLRFGDPTSYTAMSWMATQIARFGLGGEGLPFEDAAITGVAKQVLIDGADLSTRPITVNGAAFDPAAPTATYR